MRRSAKNKVNDAIIKARDIKPSFGAMVFLGAVVPGGIVILSIYVAEKNLVFTTTRRKIIRRKT